MSYSQENLSELGVLMLYDLSNHQQGIKIHKTADVDKIEAAKRLFEKGLISQADGGYLTTLGNEAAEQAQSLFTMLNAHSGE